MLKGAVPAVRNVAAILRLLRSDPGSHRTMTSIARTLGLNGSTCHNLLKTLESEGFVSYDPKMRNYDLGLALIDLASGMGGHAKVVQTAANAASAFNASCGMACFLVVKAREHFLVLHKVESVHAIKVTIDVGTYFPLAASALLKVYLAWQRPETVAEFLRDPGLPHFTPGSVTEPETFVAGLADVRASGFGLSLREYHPDHHAIAAPIFDGQGMPAYYFLTIGFANDLADPVLLEEYAGYLKNAADEVTRRTNGRNPGRRSPLTQRRSQ